MKTYQERHPQQTDESKDWHLKRAEEKRTRKATRKNGFIRKELR